MQFTGYETTKLRNFYSQTGNFNFQLTLSVDNTTGVYHFGVSGQSGILGFTMTGGQIIDPSGYYVNSYYPNEVFSIEFQAGRSGYNILKNAVPLVAGLPLPYQNYNYFYFSRSDPSISGRLNLTVDGQNKPIYSISNFGYLISTGQTAVTGTFHNNGNYPIRIFASSAQTNQNIGFSGITGDIQSNSSQSFTYSADFSSVGPNGPILTEFATNFDGADVMFNIIDLRNYLQFVLLQPISLGFNNSNSINTSLFYNNYSGGRLSSFNSDLSFSIQYVSGSGEFVISNFNTGVNFLTTGYGNFAQSGALTGIYMLSTGNAQTTGIFTVLSSQFAWATGAATGIFSGVGSGWATGLGYTGWAEGAFTGQETGFIYPGSGTLQFNGFAVGVASVASSIDYTGYYNATGYINISQLHPNDVIYIGTLYDPIIKGLQFNNETGLVYYLSGNQDHLVNGYYSGSNIYLNSIVSGKQGNGIIIQPSNCNFGLLTSSSFLTGGANFGNTGISVIAVGPFTGIISATLTGSGNYDSLISGFSTGTFQFQRTFTGDWDLLTGLSSSSLSSMKANGQFSPTTMSGSGWFAPNSFVSMKIVHNKQPGPDDEILLTISGSKVINPIQSYLIN